MLHKHSCIYDMLCKQKTKKHIYIYIYMCIYIHMALSHRHDRKEIRDGELPGLSAECCIRCPGPSWAGPFWPPPGPHGLGPCGPPQALLARARGPGPGARGPGPGARGPGPGGRGWEGGGELMYNRTTYINGRNVYFSQKVSKG